MAEHYLPKETSMRDFIDKLIKWFPKLADDRFRMLYQEFYEKWKYNREAEVSYRFWVWLQCRVQKDLQADPVDKSVPVEA